MSQIIWLEDNDFRFPEISTALAEPDGLLAASEQLSPQLVIEAYQRGIFPWYSEGQPVLWWSPDPRCILYPEKFHVSRSFQRTLNSKQFDIRTNTAFKEVMLACAAPRITDRNTDDSDSNASDNNEPGTWITQTMIDVYCQLHETGIAHSIECWQDDKLVGGLYGVGLGGVFFGESMFSTVTDSSKTALVELADRLKSWDFSLIDCQVVTGHLRQFGAREMDGSAFQNRLKDQVDRKECDRRWKTLQEARHRDRD